MSYTPKKCPFCGCTEIDSDGYPHINGGRHVQFGCGSVWIEGDSIQQTGWARDKLWCGGKVGMLVAPGSLCRRPVGIAADDAAGEWKEEEKEDRPTLEEELAKTNEYLQRTLKENMELHNRSQRLQEHVDSLKKQLAALEEKLKAQEKTSAVVIEAARQERVKLINERDDLRQEVLNLQHSLTVARTENEKLRSNPANSSLLQYEKKIAELQQRLQVSEEGRLRLMHTDSVSVQQSETEVEKLAREVYIYSGSYSAKDSFQYAEEFIAERNRRRKESGK